MSPEARRVVQLARQARSPTAEDKRRIRAAVAVGVATAAIATPAAAAGASTKMAGALGALGGARAVVAIGLAVSTSVGVGAYWHLHASARHAVKAPIAAAAQPSEPVLAPPLATIPAEPAPLPPAPTERTREEPARPRAAPQDPLAAELTLLHAAKEAWQEGQARSALELVQKHARLYPHSQLASEREALRVFALCGLGRTSEAREAASVVLTKAPGSPFRAAIEESCAMRPSK
jgi:hypothetical protein